MKKTYTLAGGTLTFLLLASASLALAQTADGTSGTAEGTVVTGTNTGTPTNGGAPGTFSRTQKVPDGHGGWKIVPSNRPATLPAKASTTKGRNEPVLQKEREVKPPVTQAQMEESIKNRRNEIEQKKNEMKNNMQDRMTDIRKKQGERVIARLDAALARLDNIAGRIDSRIIKLGEKGVDTTKAKADLAIAKTKIAAAKTKLDSAKTAIREIMSGSGTVASSTPSGDAPGSMMSEKIMLIKEQVKGVEEALKEAHKALVVAITDFKGKSVTATTTATAGN